MQIAIVPEGQLFLELFVLVVFDLVQLQISKFGVEFINVFDLICFLRITLKQILIIGFDVLER